MLNPDFSIFSDNMFAQVRQILNGVTVHTNEELIDVTVGEPRMPPPDWLVDQLMAESKNWQAYPKAYADQAFLDDLYVEPNYRGQKIAQKLISYLKSLSEANNWNGIRWITHSSNENAKKLYDKIANNTGFELYELKGN